MTVLTSTLPAAINALVDICTAAPSLATAQVFDGPPIGDLSNGDLVFIGWSPTDLAASTVQDFAYAGARRRDEVLTIGGYVESRGGGTDMKAVRARVFALLAAFEEALRATDAEPQAPTLRGTVLWAHFTSGTLVPQQTEDGALAGISFTITCQARI